MSKCTRVLAELTTSGLEENAPTLAERGIYLCVLIGTWDLHLGWCLQGTLVSGKDGSGYDILDITEE